MELNGIKEMIENEKTILDLFSKQVDLLEKNGIDLKSNDKNILENLNKTAILNQDELKKIIIDALDSKFNINKKE